MKIKRLGSASWNGGFQDGSGTVSTASTALAKYPYAVASRFDDKAGTNPEELVGAAHASCFTMAFTMVLSQAGLIADQLDTAAEVVIESVEQGFAITSIHLTLKASIPDLAPEKFQELAELAKLNCPVSKLLTADISLEATLA